MTNVRKRIVLLGKASHVAVNSLRWLLAEGIEVPVVINDPVDTGSDTWRPSLKRAALELGYREGTSLLAPNNPSHESVLEIIRRACPDVILSVQYKRLIRQPIIQSAHQGVVNMHNAPLPLLRGCDPFAWAIHDGLQYMGVSLHMVEDEGVDNGPIIAQRLWPISDETTAWDLYLQSVQENELLLTEALPGFLSGDIRPAPQNNRCATYHPYGQFVFGDLGVDWDKPAVTLSTGIRARVFPPFQLPHFKCKGDKVEIIRCRTASQRGQPGTILSTAPLVVAAKAGSIELMELRHRNRDVSGSQLAGLLQLEPGIVLANTETH